MPADRGNIPCPCGRAAPYAACCARWHAGAPAPDAEALMRSRYAAFVLGLSDYLLATWHPGQRPANLALDTGTTWLGLEVRRHVADGDRAEVEFVARFRHGGGRAVRQHETSRFVREDGRWFYVDGVVA
ncbi:YchJ family protein [Dokdonella sp. MW10]|uniref:YchJ family protein n=1 Tax=Dokdonella sp. MW10 TaxID=2992926 RepID=UPI003F7E3CED